MVSCSTVFSAGTSLHTTANCTAMTCPIANITGEVLRQSTAGAPQASLRGSEWQTVRQKKVGHAKYGRRKDGEHPFKAIPRRHDFVVFNVPPDCSVDTIKSHITNNGVQVLDIRRLSKYEWNNQSFCVTVLHVKEPTVSDPEFWPEDIGYICFFKKRINQQNNERKNNIIIGSLNCEGIRRSSSYICDILKSTSCDILCLQETCTMDSHLEHLFNIHSDYLFTCISGLDHTVNIIKGRPYGGVAIFYKKSISNVITHIKSSNRRV